MHQYHPYSQYGSRLHSNVTKANVLHQTAKSKKLLETVQVDRSQSLPDL